MEDNSPRKLREIAHLWAEIQNDLQGLSGDEAGIVQLFFDPEFSVYEISEVYELPSDKINEVISDFLVELLGKSHMLKRCLGCSSLAGEEDETDLRGQVNQLIESCETPESIGARIRELVGTAIQISIPPVPCHVWSELMAKLEAVTGLPKGHTAKFPIKLKEKDFFLGRERIVADIEAMPVAKTCSDGTVLVERGVERVEVRFHIELQERAAGEYAIKFNNLPKWATPVSFSFAVRYEAGKEKEYTLPSEFREATLYLKVENQEQEMAFLDRKEAYIGFIIGEPPEG